MLDIYTLSPICSRCVITERRLVQYIPLSDIRKHSFVASLIYLIKQAVRPPAILLNGRLVSAGHIPTEDEIKNWIQDVHNPEH